jgi:FemAB-related protein (PEP-CTERM system-associated)
MTTVRLVRPDDHPRWNEYVQQQAGLSHCIEWKGVIEAAFGHRTRYWLAEDASGALCGILPSVHLKSVLFGNFIVALPYLNDGGVCASDTATLRALLDAAIADARGQGATHIEFRQNAPLDAEVGLDLPVKTSKVAMRLPLPEDAEVLFKSFDAKLRSQIRRPTKEGMTARIGRLEELDAFYHVFARNMRDLGTPVYARAFFRRILDAFPTCSWICTVYQGPTPVAAGFLIGFKETLEIPWASSLAAYNRHSPNMLLYWTALSWACEQRFRTFDFGRSTPGEGTYRFKAQWGAKPHPLYWHYWLREGGPLPELNPHNPKYRAAIALWKKLPVGLTKLIGPSIVRNLP